MMEIKNVYEKRGRRLLHPAFRAGHPQGLEVLPKGCRWQNPSLSAVFVLELIQAN
jgi:hypothetical protein